MKSYSVDNSNTTSSNFRRYKPKLEETQQLKMLELSCDKVP